MLQEESRQILEEKTRYTKDFIREKILIVDDDPFVLSALCATLAQDNYEIFTATNGAEALQILSQNKFALLICDQILPDISGTEVIKQCLLTSPETIRIVLTGNSDFSSAIENINIGQISQYILKPWDDVALRHMVFNSIEKFRLTRENQLLTSLTERQHKALVQAHENLHKEFLLGSRIQSVILSGKIPENIQGLKIKASSIPSSEVDGDFFDFFQPASNIFSVVLGDVMGKGIPAALVGTAVKTQLVRFALPFKRWQGLKKGIWEEDLLSPEEIISNVHKEINQSLIELEFFVTLFFGRFNLYRRILTYVDCGSVKPLHYQSQLNEVVQLKGDNTPLGVTDKTFYTSKVVSFEENDLFVFYSDGITEAQSPSGELYGEKRVIEFVKEHYDNEPEEIIAKIKNSVINFTKKEHLDDDLTIIVIKISGLPQLKKKEEEGRFRSHFSQLEAVRDFIHKMCLKAPGDSNRLSAELQLVVNEIFCNIVKHAYKGLSSGLIIIKGEILEEGISLSISDQGEAFDPTQIHQPSLIGDQEDGYGWYIIYQIVDEVSYGGKTNAHGWNRLRVFKKYLSQGDTMEVSHQIKDNILIIEPKGTNLDAKEAPLFKQKVLEIISKNDIHRLIFDLKNLQFIDSSGLGCILSLLRATHTHEGDLKLSNLSKALKTMFELVSMHKIFEIYNTTDDALRSFGVLTK